MYVFGTTSKVQEGIIFFCILRYNNFPFSESSFFYMSYSGYCYPDETNLIHKTGPSIKWCRPYKKIFSISFSILLFRFIVIYFRLNSVSLWLISKYIYRSFLLRAMTSNINNTLSKIYTALTPHSYLPKEKKSYSGFRWLFTHLSVQFLTIYYYPPSMI